MLIGVQNVAIVPVDKIRNRGNHAFAVRASQQQDGGVLHK